MRTRRGGPRSAAISPLSLSVLLRTNPRLVAGLAAGVAIGSKGYLRAGAWICGEPAWDPDFNTADLPILLPVSRLDARYAKHFMGNKD